MNERKPEAFNYQDFLRVKAERDAALKRIRGECGCMECRYSAVAPDDPPCDTCKERSAWEWRGLHAGE